MSTSNQNGLAQPLFIQEGILRRLTIVKRRVLFASLCFILTGTLLNANTALAGQEIKNNPSTKNLDHPDHYLKALSHANQNLKHKRRLATEQPQSWLRQQWLSDAYIARAELTGDLNDYYAAQQVLERAFLIAGAKRGPFLARAKLNFSLHRLPSMESDLKRAESALLVDEITTNTIKGLRADTALYSAQYEQALLAYQELEASKPTMQSAIRLSNYYFKVGRYETAVHWIDEAESRIFGHAPHLRAWLTLQRGIANLEQGQFDNALAQYNKALALFPGYWLVEEHIAEIDAIQGRMQLAESRYRDLIKRTDEPMFKIALAQILAEYKSADAKAESNLLLVEATEQYNALYERLPEVIGGHAISHLIEYDQPEKVLTIALKNNAMRPGGESAVQLMQAYVVNGDLDNAKDTLDEILSTPYRSAEMHASASVVLAEAGLSEQSNTQQLLALDLNPHSIDDIEWLRAKLQK